MKYYQIDFPTDSQKVGIYPQIEYFYVSNYDQNSNTSFNKLSSEQFSEVTPNLNCFFLHKSAKITNIISASILSYNIGLFADNDFLNLLNTNQINNFKHYPITVDLFHKSSKKVSLNFIHIIENSSIINYNKTTVFDILSDKHVVVGSKQDFILAFSDDASSIFTTGQYVINSPVDLIRLPMSIHIHVSEKFKTISEESGISGIEFKPTDKIILA